MALKPNYVTGTSSKTETMSYEELEEIGIEIEKPYLTKEFEVKYSWDGGARGTHYLGITAKRFLLSDKKFFFGEDDRDDWKKINRALGE